MSMLQINLLSHETSFPEQQKRAFIRKIIGSFSFALLLLLVCYIFLIIKVDRFKQQSAILSQEILQQSTGGKQFILLQQYKNKLQQALQRLQKVYSRQEHFLLLLVRLGNLVPSGVQIETLKLQQSMLDIKGKAISYVLLAQFINKLEHAQVLEKTRLEETKADAEKNITFSLLGEV